MFISMSLRKQLHSSEPEFGACKHALGTQVSRKDVEGALTLAKLDSLHHNEAINVIFPNEVPSDTGEAQRRRARVVFLRFQDLPGWQRCCLLLGGPRETGFESPRSFVAKGHPKERG